MNKYSLILFNLNGHILDSRLLFMKSFLSLYDNLEMKITSFDKLLSSINEANNYLSFNDDFKNIDYETLLDTFKRIVSSNISSILLYEDEMKVLSFLKKEKVSLYTYSYREDNELLSIYSKSDIKDTLKKIELNTFFDNHLIIDDKRKLEEEFSSFILKEGYSNEDALIIKKKEEINNLNAISCIFDDNYSKDNIINSYHELEKYINVK